MQKQNLSEYRLLRSEFESIKSCVTNYVSFLFIGIGITLSVIATILNEDDTSNYLIPMCLVGFSVITTFMLLVLMYKFISHNRYVGYCKLLCVEKWDSPSLPIDFDELHLWETCLGRLRTTEKIRLKKISEAYPWAIKAKTIFDNDNKPTNWISSINFLVRIQFGFIKSTSWGFPVSIVRIFSITTFASILTATLYYTTTLNGRFSLTQEFSNGPITFVSFVIFALIFSLFWLRISHEFHAVMRARFTIDSYFKRFKEVRFHLLKEDLNIDANVLSPLINEEDLKN